MENSFTPEEWVLVFLYAGHGRAAKNPGINGILMFTKQFFVFVKEVKSDLQEYFNFIPYDYGPYSFVLKKIIDDQVNEGYIVVEKSDDRQDFILTYNGVEKAEMLSKNLDKKTKQTLENLRREATQLGYRGVLRYVYSRYPEYTTASKIRERVLHGR